MGSCCKETRSSPGLQASATSWPLNRWTLACAHPISRIPALVRSATRCSKVSRRATINVASLRSILPHVVSRRCGQSPPRALRGREEEYWFQTANRPRKSQLGRKPVERFVLPEGPAGERNVDKTTGHARGHDENCEVHGKANYSGRDITEGRPGM